MHCRKAEVMESRRSVILSRRSLDARIRAPRTQQSEDYTRRAGKGKPPRKWVTSSCLCKKSEGAVLPLLIESLKNRIDDSLHAGHIHEQDHGPGAPADFHEASFDGIGGAQLAPQRLREIEERQQFGQIALQPAHQCRIDPLPAKPKSLEGATGLRGVARQIDALRIAFDLRLVAAPYAVAQVAHPVHPTALVTRAGVDGFDG